MWWIISPVAYRGKEMIFIVLIIVMVSAYWICYGIHWIEMKILSNKSQKPAPEQNIQQIGFDARRKMDQISEAHIESVCQLIKNNQRR